MHLCVGVLLASTEELHTYERREEIENHEEHNHCDDLPRVLPSAQRNIGMCVILVSTFDQ